MIHTVGPVWQGGDHDEDDDLRGCYRHSMSLALRNHIRSIAFPANCAWSDRASWSRWSMSFNVWSSPFEGTPGADNSDVSCY